MKIEPITGLVGRTTDEQSASLQEEGSHERIEVLLIRDEGAVVPLGGNDSIERPDRRATDEILALSGPGRVPSEADPGDGADQRHRFVARSMPA